MSASPRPTSDSVVLISPGRHPLEFFYRTHDPTTVNKQGKDTGTRMSSHFHVSNLSSLSSSPFSLSLLPSRPEYRSAIFYNTPEQEEIAKRVTEEVQKKHFDPVGASIPHTFASILF